MNFSIFSQLFLFIHRDDTFTTQYVNLLVNGIESSRASIHHSIYRVAFLISVCRQLQVLYGPLKRVVWYFQEDCMVV